MLTVIINNNIYYYSTLILKIPADFENFLKKIFCNHLSSPFSSPFRRFSKGENSCKWFSLLEIATWSPLPLRQFSNGENFANNFIHCSDMARGTPLPYRQFPKDEKIQDGLSSDRVARDYLEVQDDWGTRLSETYCNYKRNRG